MKQYTIPTKHAISKHVTFIRGCAARAMGAARLGLILALFLLLIPSPAMAEEETPAPAAPAAPAGDVIQVSLNGAILDFDVPPQLIDNRTMVPMRRIFEALGANVEWDPEARTITATKEASVMLLRIDDTLILVDGVEITLDVPPQLVDNRTLVPVRAVAEGLKADVAWEESIRTVFIVTQDAAAEIIPPAPVVEASLTQVFSLLDDRLHITMPEGTINYLQTFTELLDGLLNLRMEDNLEKTTLLYAEGEEYIVVEAMELFRYASGSLRNDILYITDKVKETNGFAYTFSDVIQINTAEMIIATPDKWDFYSPSILLKTALVRMPDNTLIIVTAYANLEMVLNCDYCMDLADMMLRSIQLGRKTFDTSPRTSTVSQFEMAIPKDYVLSSGQIGESYLCIARKITGIYAPDKSPAMQIIISDQVGGISIPAMEWEKLSGNLLGQEVAWVTYQYEDVLWLEAVLELPDSGGKKLYIGITANTESELNEMRAMANSLRRLR